ncbi:MAG: Protein of uncharacterized function [Variovorax sp.]|nr:Protein of uncharacterized function [Variovorax sp.]
MDMSAIVLIGGLFFLAVLALFVLAWAGRRRRVGFRPRPFLTANELEFLGRLEAAAPELRFHAQVSMGALLQPSITQAQDAQAFMAARGRFSQKIVDFVAQRRDTGAVVAVIELDDRTHEPERDQRRDAMLHEAQYRVVRWQSRAKPDRRAIRAELCGPHGP